MRVLLMRHASAGDRSDWQGDDGLRPLDGTGRRQAEALAPVLAEFGTQALLSSPAVRCVQTFEPASKLLGLPIEARPELAEGSTRTDVLGLLEGVRAPLPSLSMHGDVIEELLPGRACKKGAIWVVEVDGVEIRPERYLPPPA
jgi:8-oxo-dGTP diphosphatase